MHQQGFTRLELTQHENVVPHREQCFWQRSALLVVDGLGKQQAVVGSCDGRRSIATTLHQCCNSVPHGKLVNTGSKGRYLTCDLKTQYRRGVLRYGIKAQSLEDIGTIDAGKVHCNGQLTGSGSAERILL